MSERIFNSILDNIEELRIQYSEFLTPFFSYRNFYGKKEWKKAVYELPIRYECKEWLWQALNGDIEIKRDKKGKVIINDFFEETINDI